MISKERPTFNIVENDYVDVDMDEFEKMFFDPYTTVQDIYEHFDIGLYQYTKMKKELSEKLGYPIRKPSNLGGPGTPVHEMRYISRVKNGKWRVSKTINGKTHHFGHWSTVEVAKTVRNALESSGWDKNVYQMMRGRLH